MAVARQSSSTGAIVYAVIATVLFVVAAVVAVMQFAAADAAEKRAENLAREYGDIINQNETKGADVAALTEARQDEAIANSTPLLTAARQMTDLLGAAVTGTPNNSFRASIDALQQSQQTAQQTINEEPGGDTVSIDQSNAIATIQSLTSAVVQQLQQKAALEQQLQQAQADMEQLRQQTTTQLAQRDQAVEEAQTKLQQTLQQNQQTTESAGQTVEGLVQQMTQLQQTAQQDLENKDAQLREQAAELERLNTTVRNLTSKLEDFQLSTDQLVRSADGQIEAVAGNNTVYISLGRGDQISPGMTFEVFDAAGGVPSPLTDSPEENATSGLPRGKASIEVVRVQPNNAECRIIASRGAPVQEGDLIVNVAYDRNVPLEFYVYGSFDLDRDGRATTADTQVVRQLVTQFGSEVTDELDANTSFLVIGIKPTIPEGLDPGDPIDKVILQEAEEAVRQYDETLRQAQALNIPILNQNRFLVFTGYYELAPR